MPKITSPAALEGVPHIVGRQDRHLALTLDRIEPTPDDAHGAGHRIELDGPVAELGVEFRIRFQAGVVGDCLGIVHEARIVSIANGSSPLRRLVTDCCKGSE